ncbi:MAG: hypothetical protein PG981_001547 [Wolbachia endosymbiont of Ctenocephalides orientis wCori]|nr:MAG: hypothetical protein PG981_001547 [Wolbachia endosymbiont of Ctenocephalides orientis wCori]
MSYTTYTSESETSRRPIPIVEQVKEITLALNQWTKEVKKIDEAVKDLDARFIKAETELKHEIEILKHDLPVQEDTWAM